jgi:hypothetical protein
MRLKTANVVPDELSGDIKPHDEMKTKSVVFPSTAGRPILSDIIAACITAIDAETLEASRSWQSGSWQPSNLITYRSTGIAGFRRCPAERWWVSPP